jgi:DNA-binding response OmpR family regulator
MEAAAAPDYPAHERRCVLVAEDDEEMRDLLRSTLLEAGFDVIDKPNGTEAMNLLRAIVDHPEKGRLDMAVLDVNMPGASGIRLLSWIRRAMSSVPVVLITAFGSPQFHEQAERMGASKVFDKPFPLSSLVEYVEHIGELPSPSGRGLG